MYRLNDGFLDIFGSLVGFSLRATAAAAASGGWASGGRNSDAGMMPGCCGTAQPASAASSASDISASSVVSGAVGRGVDRGVERVVGNTVIGSGAAAPRPALALRGNRWHIVFAVILGRW